MLVGIDESGAFDYGSFAYVAGIHVRPSRSDVAQEIHREWERDCRQKGFHRNGEVKGRLLDDESMISFAHDVMGTLWPSVRYTCMGFPVDGSALEYATTQKTLTNDQLGDAIRFYVDRNGGESSISNQYRNLQQWWNARSETSILKVIALGELIAKCLAFAVPYSAAHDFDAELDQLNFLVDNGIWPNEEQIVLWKEILRNQFWHATWREPVPLVDDWQESHPFLETFVEEIRGTTYIMKPTLKDRIRFANSTEAYQVRMADVIASIVRRYYLISTESEVADSIRKFHSSSGSMCTLLVLADSLTSSAPNPFLAT